MSAQCSASDCGWRCVSMPRVAGSVHRMSDQHTPSAGGPGLHPLQLGLSWCHLQLLQLPLLLNLPLSWHGLALQLSQLSQGRHRERRALRRVAIAGHHAGRVAQG